MSKEPVEVMRLTMTDRQRRAVIAAISTAHQNADDPQIKRDLLAAAHKVVAERVELYGADGFVEHPEGWDWRLIAAGMLPGAEVAA